MTKQKTVIDQLLTMLEFRADAEAPIEAEKKLMDFNRRLQALAHGLNIVVPDNVVAQERRNEC